jgi:hypothetical protein
LDSSGERFLYHVYILRFWQEPGDGQEQPVTRRFVIEDPKTGQRRGFTELNALVDFLKLDLQAGKSSQT